MIWVQNVSKRFSLYEKPAARILGALGSRSASPQEFWALREINLVMRPGEVLGIVGPNGSGKSTLLQVISGIIEPTTGRVVVEGRVSALLELGAGFNPELTGRENVYINGELLGLSRSEIDQVFPDIASFAGVGPFIDRPVKEYSSGMYVRLAFATAIHVRPDVLIVDEALAVGDALFSSKCIRRLEEMKRAGVTILFVSHDLGILQRLSDRAILMLQGRIARTGTAAEVVNDYVAYVHQAQPTDEVIPESQPISGARHGDGSSVIRSVELQNRFGASCRVIDAGDILRVAVHIQFRQSVHQPVVGILLRDRLGFDVYGTNTKVEQTPLGDFDAGGELTVTFDIACWLAAQEYTITAATQHDDGHSQDWWNEAASFTVQNERQIAGIVQLPTSVAVHRAVAAAPVPSTIEK